MHLFTLSWSCWGFKRHSTRSACTMQTAAPAENSARFVLWDLLERQIKCYFGVDIASFIGIYLFSSPPLHPKEPGLLNPLGSHWIIRETGIILHFLVENVGMYTHRNVSQVAPSPFKIHLNSLKSTWIHHGSPVTVLLHNPAHLKKNPLISDSCHLQLLYLIISASCWHGCMPYFASLSVWAGCT